MTVNGAIDLSAVVDRLDSGAPVDARDNEGRTALIIAASVIAACTCADLRSKWLSFARELLQMGADPNIADHQGKTAIMHAVATLDGGSNPHQECARDNVVAINGNAANGELINDLPRRGVAEILTLIAMLVDHGASLDRRDVEGNTEVDLAMASGNDGYASYLRRKL